MGTAVIFGASGQDGHYLSRLLRSHGVQVVGTSRKDGEHAGDVSDFGFVESVIKRHHPDFVFHLAATSSARHSFLFENHQSISTGTLNILENVYRSCSSARVFLSGSALQFRNQGLPIDEDCEFEASSAYALARIHSTYAGRYYRAAFGLHVFVGYFFNHDSPMRSESHVNQAIAAAASRIAAGSDEVVTIGNASVRKEFNFAGDIVDAAWALVQQDKVYEAVIGCGETHTIREWAELCFSLVGLNLDDHLVVPEGFVAEYDVLVSKPTLIRSLGWKPTVGMQGLVEMMMGKE
ncbi:MAG: epimerase [Gammaproteobacteria bacterium RIFCSPHIGHO2_12_FULL_63_22]|nr:MAG: epimerase [Gammaproteobacteria bacterium RIFCSPHIGHO2_12_FULL_63_22]